MSILLRLTTELQDRRCRRFSIFTSPDRVRLRQCVTLGLVILLTELRDSGTSSSVRASRCSRGLLRLGRIFFLDE